jgi:hypothetical protein
MSRNLNQEQKSNLSQAIDRFIEAGEELKKAPRFSTRGDQMVGAIGTQLEVARKLKSELDPEGATSQNPPDRPDSNRGDEDNTKPKGTVPQGLTSTHSQSRKTPTSGANERDTRGNPIGKQRESEINLTPGLSGHPVKKDDRERRGNTFTVDSTSHRQAREMNGEPNNADTLPKGTDPDQQAEMAAIIKGSNAQPVNVSHPIKQGMDTTNTGTEGSPTPDNFFAEDAKKHADMSAKDDADNDQIRKSYLDKQAEKPRKYDSENRVATENYEHAAAKEKEANASAGGPKEETVRGADGEGDFNVKSGNQQSTADQGDPLVGGVKPNPLKNEAGGKAKGAESEPAPKPSKEVQAQQGDHSAKKHK